MILSVIVAFDRNRLIGNKNDLPWHLPADLRHFKNTTMGSAMIMGRKTFESIGKPLPGRRSIVITRNKAYHHEGVTVAQSLDEAIAVSKNEDQVFIIGGAQIFNEALPIADKLYVTLIDHEFEGDTWFPEISAEQWEPETRTDHEPDEKNRWPYSFRTFVRKK